MEVYYQIVRTAAELTAVCEEMSGLQTVGLDCETTELDPYKGELRLVQIAVSPTEIKIIDLRNFPNPKENPALDCLRNLLFAPRPTKVLHNAKFDAKWLKLHIGAELGGVFDTLLASQIIAAGEMERRHNLGDVTYDFLGEELDKSQQVSDWGAAELSLSQLEYAARDAGIVLRIREKMIERLKADALIKVAQLEFECVQPVAELELAGFFLDKERWLVQLEKVKKQQLIVADELQDLLSGGVLQGSLFGRSEINLDSHTQLTDALTRLGVPLPPTTRNWQLEPLANDYPVVKKLLEYRTIAKAISSYGENILTFINPKTGRLHADFRQIGAPTGRFSCNNPNIQQVPHGAEYRRCFRAPAGRKLIISDYSQIELRILADFTGDEGFVGAFQAGADLHRETAARIFNVAPDDVTGDQRSFAKRINFGVVYGIGAQRVSNLTGISLNEAQELLRKYFQTYRKLDTWLRDAASKATRERSARTISGRLAKFRFDPEDRQAISLAERNGKNTPIQGCVVGETRIFESQFGYVRIKDLVDRAVSVWDGERFVNAYVAASGLKQLVKIEFWGGYAIECSPEHKFLTIDVNGRKKWRTAAEFVKGNYVVLAEPVGDWAVELNLPDFQAGTAWNSSRASLADVISEPFDLGIWLGRLASDGSLTNHQAYQLVAQHEEAVLPQIKSFSEKFGHVNHQIRTGGRGTQKLHFLTTSALGLTNQLRDCGVKTRVPDFAWRNSRILAGYLRGMFDGDGTVNRDGAILTFGKGGNFHLEWAREIQQALLLFGIRSRINRCADRINVCVLKRDMPLFSQKIGFINSLKQSKAEAVEPQTNYENKIYGRAARIKKVEFTDEFVEMYDVVNSETERFMANGLVTHNSSADIFKRALRLLHEELRDTSACVVNIIHDEIVVEADEQNASQIAEKMENAMCRAGEEYVKKVPIKVESEIADEWLK